MAELKFITGNATEMIGDGPKVLMHLCNNKNAFGAGFALAVAKKWPHVKDVYHNFFKQNPKFSPEGFLGYTVFVHVVDTHLVTHVANMIAQNGLGIGVDRVSYKHLQQCLNETFSFARRIDASVHAPMIGSGLAGGNWDKILQMIQDCVVFYDIDCYIYKLEE